MTIDLSSVAIKPPAIPHKTEIIPIHTSDRATFKRCRRRWDWSSPMRMNLRSAVSQVGVYMPLWFGSGIHYALAQFYNPMLRRDPEEAFRSWYEIQWNGGIITEEELELTYDPNPRLHVVGSHNGDDTELEAREGEEAYEVYGLRDLHPDPDESEFLEHRELGIEMMKFYRDIYVPAEDNFAVICEEHQFSVPTGISAIDPRDGVRKEVHYRGRQDAIIQHQESGRFGILEHKTAAQINEDYFAKLDKDEQVTSYMWAAEREAEEYGLEYGQIDFTLYNGIRKAFPKPPTETQNGLFSIDRQKESTTIAHLEKFIEERGIGVVVAQSEKHQNYIEYVRELGYKQFVERKLVTRNRAEVNSCGTRLRMEICDMLGLYTDPEAEDEFPLIYPNPTGDWMCLRCPFRAPCIAKDDGSDWEQILNDGYERNVGR